MKNESLSSLSKNIVEFRNLNSVKVVQKENIKNDIIKNINDINSLYEYLDAVKFIFMNSLTFFEYCESMDTDFIINIDNLINLLPKTTYGDLFRRKLEKFKYLTSKRNGINVHKNAVQLSQIQDDYIKTR